MKIFKIVISLFILNTFCFGSSFPSSYYNIKDTSTLKKRFVFIMLPIIKQENEKILQDRDFIKNTLGESIFLINQTNIKRLIALKRKYKIARIYDLRAYLRKIDIIPPSLALAQAAIESGWGKSRFAKEANNLFGQWTYSGIGMIPSQREDGATHRIRIFNDLNDSVANYMLNLNIGWAYTDFRIKRYELRSYDKEIDGYILADTLSMYSSAGQEYIDKVKHMINSEGFSKFD